MSASGDQRVDHSREFPNPFPDYNGEKIVEDDGKVGGTFSPLFPSWQPPAWTWPGSLSTGMQIHIFVSVYIYFGCSLVDLFC